MNRAAQYFAPILFSAIAIACGEQQPTAQTPPATGGSGGGSSCPKGQVQTADGACVSVGPQSCADELIGTEGLCRPLEANCPPGTIPKVDQGCIAVGIPGCAEEFLEEGTCIPSVDKCKPGEFAVPSGCISIDGAEGCGSAPWGHIVDEPKTVWVNSSHEGASDGSQAQPFKTITEALAVVPSEGRIALAAGNYDEPISIKKPLSIIGRCPSRVLIRGTVPVPYAPAPAIVYSEGPKSVRIEGIRIGGPGIGIVVGYGHVDIERVVIDQSSYLGVAVIDGSATMKHVLVVDTAAGDPPMGRGVTAIGGTLAIERSAILRSRDTAVNASQPNAVLTMDDCLVETTWPDDSGKDGAGVSVRNSAKAEIRRSAFIHNRTVGVMVGKSATALVDQSVIARTDAQPTDGDYGRGVVVQGAELSVERTVIEDNRDNGVFVSVGGSATLLDSVVRNTLPSIDASGGTGILVQESSTAILDGSLVIDNTRTGVAAVMSINADKPVELTVRNSIVAQTRPTFSDGSYGIGLVCSGPNLVTVVDTIISDNQTASLLAGACKVDVASSLFDRVRAGTFHHFDGNQNITESFHNIADGLVAHVNADVSISGSLVEGERTSLLYDSSSGQLTSVVTRNARFGLVTQGDPKPTIYPLSYFSGSEHDVVTDGALPVADPPVIPTD